MDDEDWDLDFEAIDLLEQQAVAGRSSTCTAGLHTSCQRNVQHDVQMNSSSILSVRRKDEDANQHGWPGGLQTSSVRNGFVEHTGALPWRQAPSYNPVEAHPQGCSHGNAARAHQNTKRSTTAHNYTVDASAKASSGSLWGHMFQDGELKTEYQTGPSGVYITESGMKRGLSISSQLSPNRAMANAAMKGQKTLGFCSNASRTVHGGYETMKNNANHWKPQQQPVWRPQSGTIWSCQQFDSSKSTHEPVIERGMEHGNRWEPSKIAASTTLPTSNMDDISSDDWSFETPKMEDNKNDKKDASMSLQHVQTGTNSNLEYHDRAVAEQSKTFGHCLANGENQEEEHEATYEDWYNEPRRVVPLILEQSLAECHSTSGGLQVCQNAATHWVYPSHIPERKYQLYAISKALLSNTLVCYPTGLGKTLIAAVVMHNFIRWFPRSKVVFIAPTKPLVSQQMEACQRFMGLPKSTSAEMTGKARGDDRKGLWNDEAVHFYFCTPQTFWNDVRRGLCPYDLISCVVVDECHRATGQADVAQAVKHMRNIQRLKFRVLGLSATPGGSSAQVQEVINTLGISTVVFKNETDKDVKPYVHKKDSETFIVDAQHSGNTFRGSLMACLQHLIGNLSSNGHYYGAADAERVSRFGLLQARKAYNGPSKIVRQKFTMASILADVRDQLDGYGPSAALSFLRIKFMEQKCMQILRERDPQFSHFVLSLERAVDTGSSNPKIQKLKSILKEKFDPSNGTCIERAIVFATLRDGVSTILEALKPMEPTVRARAFIGQSGGGKKGAAGMKQKEQREVLENFSSGICNVLVATCIGEEGLDIPNVELIICFDSISSPTRALQRQGRTGRHGDGKVVYLVSAGKEEEQFKKAAETMRKLHKQLREADRHFILNKSHVRMLPREFEPSIAHVDILGASIDGIKVHEAQVEDNMHVETKEALYNTAIPAPGHSKGKVPKELPVRQQNGSIFLPSNQVLQMRNRDRASSHHPWQEMSLNIVLEERVKQPVKKNVGQGKRQVEQKQNILNEVHESTSKREVDHSLLYEDIPLSIRRTQLKKQVLSSAQHGTSPHHTKADAKAVDNVQPGADVMAGELHGDDWGYIDENKAHLSPLQRNPEELKYNTDENAPPGSNQRISMQGRKHHYILDSQSPLGSSPMPLQRHLEEDSAVEEFDLSHIPSVPKSVQPRKRIRRARDIKEKAQHPRHVPKCHSTISRLAAGMIDVEANISGEDSGSDDDGSHNDAMLEDFIDDATPVSGHPSASQPAWRLLHHAASPSPLGFLQRIREKKFGQQQSQQSIPFSPDEYDLEDSFINDSSLPE